MTIANASKYKASVIVTSDSCSANPALDTSGEFVVDALTGLGFSLVSKYIVKDNKNTITNCVKKALEEKNTALIITVGGTGLCPRDVTPEATSCLYDKHCTGIATHLIMTSIRYSPMAALSRLTAGIVGECLIVNFPGKLKACKECFQCLECFLGHALEQIRFDSNAIKQTHMSQEAEGEGQKPLSIADTLASVVANVSNQFQSNNDLLTLSSEIESSSMDPVIESSSIATTILSPILDPVIARPKPKLLPAEEIAEKLIPRASSLKVTNEPATSTTVEDGQRSLSRDSSASPCQTPLSLLRDVRVESKYPIISYENALGILSVFSRYLSQNKIEVNLDSLESAHEILGDVLAVDAPSKTLVPPYPVSTMDGYVINIPAGMAKFFSVLKTFALEVKNYEEFERRKQEILPPPKFICYQVNTGGRVPDDENFAVVPFEHTYPNSSLDRVYFKKIELDKYFRKAGSDLNHEDCLNAGTSIGPVELSLILAMGYKSVGVYKKPILGILSTGNELIEFYNNQIVDTSIDQVIDTNGPVLTSLFKLRGYKVINCGISIDEPQDILTSFTNGLSKCDILIVTGGASMGTKDHVKDVIKDIGGVVRFGRVNIKPGKPVAFASVERGKQTKFIFSLPGNPVSAYITAYVLVIPFIEHGLQSCMCSEICPPPKLSLDNIGDLITVEIDSILDLEEEGKPYEFDGRFEFLRGKLLKTTTKLDEKNYVTQSNARPVSVSIKQQSSRMLSLRDCDCLILIDTDRKGLHLSIGQIYTALICKM